MSTPRTQLPSPLLVGRYRLGRLLGRGAHGTVHLAEDLGRGGEQVALKLTRGQVDGGTWREPAGRALRWFRHPNWAEVLDVGYVGEYAWFQTLRYIPGTSLDKVEGPIDVAAVWQFLEDGARVLRALHRCGLIHYDVTPGNFIRQETPDGPRFVLMDGGLAHVGPVRGFTRGTPLYLAPELTEDKGHDHRVDLYSLGLVGYRLATGQEAFGADPATALPTRRRRAAPRARTLRPDLPQALDDILAALLARRPQDRPEDGRALLHLIADGAGRDVPEMRKSEAYAAADGGYLVGRSEAITRFRISRTQLTGALTALRSKSNGSTIAGIADPVLVLCGESGVGTTRLSRQMVHLAQMKEIPVVLLAGRDGAPNPQAPLDHVMDGLRDLGRDRSRTKPSRPHARSWRNRRERAYSKQQAVESFLVRVHEAARRTPFVLAVEDYRELPDLARTAVQALARDLQSRAEHGPDRAAPPVLLLIDLGPAEPGAFLIPDSEHRRRPLVQIPPLTREETLEFCAKRFPGVALAEEDLRTVHDASGGLPANLVALIGEAAHRGDLLGLGDRWEWNVTALDRYEDARRLPLHLADALRQTDARLRNLLDYVALAESHLDQAVLTDLWARIAEGPLPSTTLLTTRRDDARELVALPSRALRRALLEELHADDGLRRKRSRELLDALLLHPSTDSILDRVHLHLETGDARAAVALLATSWGDLEPERRFSAQLHVRRAAELAPELLQDADARAELAGLLERGPDAVEVATRLADALSPERAQIGAVLQVAEVLEDASDVDAAYRLLDLHRDVPDAKAAERALLRVRLCMLALDRTMNDGATALHAEAREDLKKALADEEDHDALLAEYLRLRARLEFLDGTRSRRIPRLLGWAEASAKASRSHLLHAQIANNLGVAASTSGRLDDAQRHLSRSLRLKRALGDVKGVASSTLNLARVNLRGGQVLEATRHCRDCVRSAQRYGLHDIQIRALRLLADAYDRQHRPTLALDTLLRAWRMVRVDAVSSPDWRVAWDLAPLAAAVGRLDVTEEILHATAHLARAEGRMEGARGMHHLSASIAALHAGQLARFRTSLARAQRHVASLEPEDRWILGFMSVIDGRAGVSPVVDHTHGARLHVNPPMRFLYRIHVWYRRAMRADRTAPPIPGLAGGRRGAARGIPAGSLGRIAAEFVLAAATFTRPRVDEGSLSQIQSYAGLSDAALLQTRALAIRAAAAGVSPGRQQAHHFSQAVAYAEKVVQANARALRGLPAELIETARTVARRIPADLPKTIEMRDLHALAHRALVRPGRTAPRTGREGGTIAPRERLAEALQHVLEASARMQGANGVRQLLASITQHTIDITGAQRACVVLREADTGLEIQESASVWDDDGPVALRDVSNTVIRRVLETQKPIDRPYVIEDEDLLQESASIKELGLLSILCVPLRRRGALYGVLYADSTAVGAFAPVDVEVLSLFADQAAAAIETSRLVEDVQQSFAELKAMQDRLVRGERLRVIGELSSGVAHEFNNLLTAILARIQMMGLNYLPPEARKDLELVEKAALDAAAVVRRLQSFSRSQRQADFTTVDMAEICRDAVDLLRPLWRKRQQSDSGRVTVQLRAEPELLVRGDPTELREVLTNIIKNALEGIREEGRITVAARRQRGQVHLAVEDDGAGIPSDVLSKVFEPFYTTKGERGTGLGLSLSRQIVEQHGGTINIDSVVGTGTRAEIRLPAAEPTVEVPQQETEDAESAQALRVVVVDDDPDVLKSLCTYLERSGCQVISASNGADGLQLAFEHNPDVVLTDVAMPRMSGIELCRRLHERLPRLPIVLMSGWASDLNHASAREAGAHDVLSKPFEMPEVTRLLASVAASRRK